MTTKTQRLALERAEAWGSPFLHLGYRSRVGGAYRRMVIRLGKAGLLQPSYPWGITAAGKDELDRVGRKGVWTP